MGACCFAYRGTNRESVKNQPHQQWHTEAESAYEHEECERAQHQRT